MAFCMPTGFCMIELILLFLACFAMAKRRGTGRRRRFNLRRVRITPSKPLLTLAAVTAVTTPMTAASNSTYRAMTVKATWSITDLTANDGPITVGLAHSDYSVAEIKEALLATNAIDVGNMVAQEHANRKVRVVGTLNEVRESLNNGEPISTRLNWLIGINQTVVAFAFNEGAALLSTGAVLDIVGDMWVKDSA